MGPGQSPIGTNWPVLAILVNMIIFGGLVKNSHFGHFWSGPATRAPWGLGNSGILDQNG